MKKILFFLFFAISISAYSQNNNISERTDMADARFEIIQSPVARKYTIKIDKQTGETWQMVVNSKNKLCWEKLYKGSSSEDDTKNEGKNNYIIFMGGVAAKDMFLMNINTGTCWQLVNDSSENSNWWTPMTTY